MIASATTVTVDPRLVRDDLARALAGGERDLGAWLDVNDRARRYAAARCRAAGDMNGYFELKLWESVAQLEAGRVERAFSAVREVWVASDGRVPYTAQALILTQLAACCKARGDLRGSIRAARRAEAFLVAEAGEGVPCVLAVRAWLMRCIEQRGERAAVTPVRKRLQASLASLSQQMTGAEREARLDRMRDVFVDGDTPPHWALIHLLRWRCIAA